MLTTIQGVYKDGRIELTEETECIPDGTQVLVTLLPSEVLSKLNEVVDEAEIAKGVAAGMIDLRTRGISKEQALRIRASMLQFEQFWDDPEMDVYNDYEANKAKFLSQG